MEEINAKTLSDLYRATYERHRLKAHELVMMDVKELHSLTGEKWEERILRIIPESEYQPRAPIMANISPDLEVIYPSTNQTFVVEVPEVKVVIGPLVTIGEGPLDGWLDPRRRIIRAFKRILESPSEVIAAIKENNWSLYNESITEFNQTPPAQRLSSMAREYCSFMVAQGPDWDNYNYVIIAICYCFSGVPGFSGRSLDFETAIEWSPDIFICLQGTKGIFTFDQSKSRYCLFNDLIKGRKIKTRGESIYQRLLPQFEFLVFDKQSLDVVPLSKLISNPDCVKEGVSVKTFIANQPMTVRKNRRMRIQTLSTIHRQVGERTNDLLERFVVPNLSRKRKAEGASTSREGEMKRLMLKPQANELEEDW